MKNEQSCVNVFITESNKFRAQVTPRERDEETFEVTIGSESWKCGKGQ